MMHVSYARTTLVKSIFLAGPSPRSESVPSWRPEALRLLNELGFKGTVFVPEDEDGWAKYSPEAKANFSYDHQVEWELEALHSATVVVFWVPREVETLPGFVTNVEFGLFVSRRNVVLGFPPDAQKMNYLSSIAKLHFIPQHSTLEDTLHNAILLTNRPFPTC